MATNNDTVTTLRRTPIYPSITLNGSLPTVNGVSYYSWAEALAAKAAGVTYITTNLFMTREHQLDELQIEHRREAA